MKCTTTTGMPAVSLRQTHPSIARDDAILSSTLYASAQKTTTTLQGHTHTRTHTHRRTKQTFGREGSPSIPQPPFVQHPLLELTTRANVPNADVGGPYLIAGGSRKIIKMRNRNISHSSRGTALGVCGGVSVVAYTPK